MISYSVGVRGFVNIEEFAEAFGGMVERRDSIVHFTIGNVYLITDTSGRTGVDIDILADLDGLLFANHVELLKHFRLIVNTYVVSGSFEQLTDKDIAAGDSVIWFNGHTYRNITVDLRRALGEIVPQARERAQRLRESRENTLEFSKRFAEANLWFIFHVKHEGAWDIKREDPWKKTLRSEYPGSFTARIYYEGQIMSLEELGNITYGYIGAALGFTFEYLRFGSTVVSGIPQRSLELFNPFNDTDPEKMLAEVRNEVGDWMLVERGFRAYRSDYGREESEDIW